MQKTRHSSASRLRRRLRCTHVLGNPANYRSRTWSAPHYLRTWPITRLQEERLFRFRHLSDPLWRRGLGVGPAPCAKGRRISLAPELPPHLLVKYRGSLPDGQGRRALTGPDGPHPEPGTARRGRGAEWGEGASHRRAPHCWSAGLPSALGATLPGTAKKVPPRMTHGRGLADTRMQKARPGASAGTGSQVLLALLAVGSGSGLRPRPARFPHPLQGSATPAIA